MEPAFGSDEFSKQCNDVGRSVAPDGSCVLRYELIPALQQGPLGLESATDRLQYLEDLNVLHPEAWGRPDLSVRHARCFVLEHRRRLAIDEVPKTTYAGHGMLHRCAFV